VFWLEKPQAASGLLGKLGITASYAIINTFFYSVYGSVKAATARDAKLIAYRIAARCAADRPEGRGSDRAGNAADAPGRRGRRTPNGKTFSVAYAPVTHPLSRRALRKNDKKSWLGDLRNCSKTELGLQAPLALVKT